MMHPIGRDYITKAEFEDRQRRAAKPAREQNAADIVRQLVAALERKRRESCRGTRVKGYNCEQMIPSGEYGEVADEPCRFCAPVLPALTAGLAWLEQEGR